MDSSGYVALSRQSGLVREMRVIANNVANMSTSGFKAEGLVFSEYIKGGGAHSESISMSTAHARHVVLDQGQLKRTDGALDLAIEGDGFFLVEGAEGPQLTRAGHFTIDGTGTMVSSDGHAVLDQGGAPILLPLDGPDVSIGRDGTISQNGRLVGQVGVVIPADPSGLRRVGESRFDAPEGWEPAETPNVMQGFLEASNVNAIEQMSRMIEVQRAYELGRSLINKEHDRINTVVEKLGRSS